MEVDVEGHEGGVFRGAERVLDEATRPVVVYFEHCPGCIWGHGLDPYEPFAFLLERGYRLFTHKDGVLGEEIGDLPTARKRLCASAGNLLAGTCEDTPTYSAVNFTNILAVEGIPRTKVAGISSAIFRVLTLKCKTILIVARRNEQLMRTRQYLLK